MEQVDKDLLTAQEAWSMLGISKGFFYKLKRANGLRTFTVGKRKTLYRREDILGLVQERVTTE